MVDRAYNSSPNEPPRFACGWSVASPSVVRFVANRSRGSRRRSRASTPRFLAMAASASICRPVQRGRRMAFARRASASWLLTRCALRLNEPHRTSRPLTSSVARAVLAREIHLSRSPLRIPTCVRLRNFSTGTRLSYAAVGLGATAIRRPGRLPSARCPTLRLGEAWVARTFTIA
jgi:hypothetical protein